MNSNEPLISVVMPVYNGESTIGQQLEALKRQSYQDKWELIVVDNGSDDKTAEIVQAYQQELPCLCLISAIEKKGSAYARNVGAQKACGKVLAFCDADDVVAPGWLTAIAGAWPMHEFIAGAVETELLNEGASWHPSFAKYPYQPVFGFRPFVSSCNMAISRQAFEKVGGFSEEFRHSHDVDISWRLQLQGYPIHFIPEAVVHRRFRPSLYEQWLRVSRISRFRPLLFKRYAKYGMPRSSRKRVYRRYKWLIRNVMNVFDPAMQKRSKWIHQAALAWGCLQGSLRYRVWYL